MTKEDIVRFLEECRNTHLQWYEYFKDNPQIEEEYVRTGEWDTADKHFEFVDKYKQVIEYIEKCDEIIKQEFVKCLMNTKEPSLKWDKFFKNNQRIIEYVRKIKEN